jgi:hypothetical protein
MRTHCLVAVLLFMVSAALAQEKPLSSVPTPNLGSRASASVILQQALSRSFANHPGYWEGNAGSDTRSAGSSRSRHQEVGTHQGGFSPGKLVWNFTGKHKLVPLLDLTVVKVNPTQPWSVQPKTLSEFGTFVSQHKPGDLVNKATQSLMSAMHR